MKAFFDVVLHTVKVLLLFCFCTVLFYLGLKWFDQNYESYHRYDKPSGGAQKVFEMNTTPHNHPGFNRLIEFLQSGE